MKRVRKFFTPAGFLVGAGSIGALFLICTVAGLRSYTSVISLTYPEGSSREVAEVLCLVYLVCYFLFVLVAPVLVLAAGLLAALNRLARRRAGPAGDGVPMGPPKSLEGGS